MKIKTPHLKFIALGFLLIVCSGTFFLWWQQGPSKERADKANWIQVAIDKINADYVKKYGIIRNPYDPRFDPEKFDFSYYSVNSCMVQEVLAKLFPPGSKKDFVEHILVKAGGAKKRKSSEHLGKNRYTYRYNGSWVIVEKEWIIVIQYDDQNQVAEITLDGRSVYDYHQKCNAKINFDVKE